jgi:hypothetical protein
MRAMFAECQHRFEAERVSEKQKSDKSNITLAASKRFFLDPSAVFLSFFLQTKQEFERAIRKQKRCVNTVPTASEWRSAFSDGSQGEEEWNECE